MRILFLSYYFSPDLCAGSFRATSLAEAIVRILGSAGEIEVISTIPNRYRSFSIDAPLLESSEGMTIRRVKVPLHRSGMLDQALAFRKYSEFVRTYTKKREYDLVFATSSRLMTARLAAQVARSKGLTLFLDIRDIFPDTMRDVLPFPFGKIIEPILSVLERNTIRAAAKVNLISRGFSKYFQSRYPDTLFCFYSNGVSAEFVSENSFENSAPKQGNLRIVYAGNIGASQGLEHIIPDLAIQLGSNFQFRLIGDGGRKARLAQAIASRKITNVALVNPMSRSDLLAEYHAADVFFLHLNDSAAFMKVIPSKVFEYAALGKPIWAGVAGYPAEFLRSEVKNSSVFSPCSVSDALRAFSELDIRYTPRPEFVKKFSRSAISSQLAAEIIDLANAKSRK